MAGLVPKILIGGVWTTVSARLANQVGTPLVSATLVYEFRLIPDEYVLTFSDVVPGVSATVTVACSVPNPYNGTSFSVDLDGVTEYDDIIPGLRLVFSDSGSFDDSWGLVVVAGLPLGVKNAFPPEAGQSTQFMVQVVNTGAAAGSDCKALLRPALKVVKKTGVVFADAKPFADQAVAKLTLGVVSPYVFSVSNVTGSGSSKEMDCAVDGLPFDVLNLTTEAETTSEELNVVDWYRIISGDLTGTEFKLSEEALSGDFENVLVFEPEFITIAPFDNGAPGDFGQDDVPLTTQDELEGTIPAAGEAFFYIDVRVTEFGNLKSNPYICSVAIEGSALSAAGWEA
jgi:hypothetical protein